MATTGWRLCSRPEPVLLYVEADQPRGLRGGCCKGRRLLGRAPPHGEVDQRPPGLADQQSGGPGRGVLLALGEVAPPLKQHGDFGELAPGSSCDFDTPNSRAGWRMVRLVRQYATCGIDALSVQLRHQLGESARGLSPVNGAIQDGSDAVITSALRRSFQLPDPLPAADPCRLTSKEGPDGTRTVSRRR